ncbi:MAG TPA: iron-sulfur cluster assembly scaffold protein [Rhizomicrobium sp.]|jgi:NifU-like protein involved in Fe-S cluster formation
MSDPLYRLDLLRLAAEAHGAGRLPEPQASGFAFNPACGDKVVVDLMLADGRITDLAHDTKGCVLAQASASILGASLRGAARDDVERLRSEIAAMLEAKSPPPSEPFERYSAFAGAVEYPSRYRCVLLPVEAVLDAFDRFARGKSNDRHA